MIRIKNGSVYAVYENVRYFKNDCASNCTKIISDIGGISIRAVTPISKGMQNFKKVTNTVHNTVGFGNIATLFVVIFHEI